MPARERAPAFETRPAMRKQRGRGPANSEFGISSGKPSIFREVCSLEDREISQAVIGRLPRYYRYLGELRSDGVDRISSRELSRLMHVTASQIRQDFNNFGGFGQQGYGYNVEYLYDEIGKILGLDHSHDMILIGAGHLGQALINYMNFRNRGFYFRGAFDVNEHLVGTSVAGVEIHAMDEMESFIRDNSIEIAVLCIPKTEALSIAQRLVKAGIRGIWNFAHLDLPVPEYVQVENVHLSDSLMKLSYNLKRAGNSECADSDAASTK